MSSSSSSKDKKVGLNLLQKLVKVRETLTYLKKDTSGYDWKYTDEPTLLMAIRPALDEYNIWVDQQIVEIETLSLKSFVKGKEVEQSCMKITILYTITDADSPENTMFKNHIMIEPGCDCKKIGAVLTYSNRYFWFKFLQIPVTTREYESFEASSPDIELEKTQVSSGSSWEDTEAMGKAEDEDREKFKSILENIYAQFPQEERENVKDYIAYLSKVEGRPWKQIVLDIVKDYLKTKEKFAMWKGETRQKEVSLHGKEQNKK